MSSNPRNRVFSVFAGDLSFFCEEVDLYQLFRPFGEILRATIVRGKEGKSAKKTSYFGFVDFPTRASAQRAIEALHGKMFLGRIMAVNSTETTAPKKNYRAWHKVAIGFTAVCDWSVDEQCLRDVFEEFGPLADVVVRDYDVMGSRVVNGRKMTEATGYADVYFLDVRQAMRAVEAVTYADAVNGSSLSRHRWIRLSLLNPDDVAVIGAQQRSLRPALSAGDVQRENANNMLMQEQYARRLTDSYLFHEQMSLENSFSLGLAPSIHSRPLSLTPHQQPFVHDFERDFEREVRGFGRDALGDIYHDGQFSRSNDHLMNFSTTGLFERERLYETVGDLPTPPQDFHHDLVALRSRDLQGGRPVVDGFASLEWEAMYAPFSRENTSSIPLGSVDGDFMNHDGGWMKHPPSSFPGTDMETLLGLSSGSATFGA